MVSLMFCGFSFSHSGNWHQESLSLGLVEVPLIFQSESAQFGCFLIYSIHLRLLDMKEKLQRLKDTLWYEQYEHQQSQFGMFNRGWWCLFSIMCAVWSASPWLCLTVLLASKACPCIPCVFCARDIKKVNPRHQSWTLAKLLTPSPTVTGWLKVRLPLLQLDLYLHVDLRNRRADFCALGFHTQPEQTAEGG